jgi:spore coat polysaccharide biosynthesis protein SpsF
MGQRVVCTIEARMTSSRLPGKVLLPVLGRPLLELMIERLRRATRVDDIVIATTEDPSSDPIEALARGLGVGCFRGSEDDVLGRVLGAARAAGADLIVETTADCPLIDPAVVDRVIEAFQAGGADYCSNLLPRTYPHGFEVQVFPTAVLADVDRRTQDPADREHVSLYIYEVPGRFRLRNVESERPEGAGLRLTVDTEDDYAVVRAVFEALYAGDPAFGLDAVLDLVAERPELLALNAHVEQKRAR